VIRLPGYLHRINNSTTSQNIWSHQLIVGKEKAAENIEPDYRLSMEINKKLNDRFKKGKMVPIVPGCIFIANENLTVPKNNIYAFNAGF